MNLINTIFNHFTDEQIEELIEHVHTEPNDFVSLIREQQQALKELLQDPMQALCLECLNEIKEFIFYRGDHAHPASMRSDIDTVGIGDKFNEYHYTKQLDIINAIYDLNKEIQYCPDDHIIYFIEDIFEWSANELEDDEAREFEKLIQADDKGNLSERDKETLIGTLGFEYR